MDQSKNSMRVAALSDRDIESINAIQSKLKTQDDKDVVLVAYEK